MTSLTDKIPRTTSNTPILITIVYFIAFVGLGLVSASLGPTIATLAEQTGSSLSQISYLFTARSLGFMIGAFVIGRRYDRVPGHPLMVALILLIAAMMVAIPLVSWLALLIPVMFFAGLGSGGTDLGGNTLLVWLHQERVGPYMNGLHLVWGIGAFLAPILIAQVVTLSGSIRWAYWLVALLLLPAVLWLPRLPSPEPQTKQQESQSDNGANTRLVALIAAFFFLYVGAEVSVSGWIFTYTVELALATETNAAYLNSAFFGALSLARIVAIPVATRFTPRQILFADLLICLVSGLLMATFATSLVALWVAVIGLGVGMASIFPTLLDLAQKYMPLSGRVTGWFFLGASSGGMVLPWLIGQFFESVGPGVVVISILTCMSLAMVIFAALVLTPVKETS